MVFYKIPHRKTRMVPQTLLMSSHFWKPVFIQNIHTSGLIGPLLSALVTLNENRSIRTLFQFSIFDPDFDLICPFLRRWKNVPVAGDIFGFYFWKTRTSFCTWSMIVLIFLWSTETNLFVVHLIHFYLRGLAANDPVNWEIYQIQCW